MHTQRRMNRWTAWAMMMAVGLAGEFRVSGFEFRFGGRALGAVVGDGDVVPGDPATWTSSTVGYVGNTGIGEVTVDAGSTLVCYTGYVGDTNGANGTITVDGAGSTWNLGYDLYVGNNGAGVLNLTNGGLVTVTDTTYVAYGDTGAGAINFGVSGGTLTTNAIYVVAWQCSGTGTINTHSLITDGNSVLDATHGLIQTLNWTGPQENVTIHLDMSVGNGGVGAGWIGAGTMTIRDGATVSSYWGILGNRVGASGTAVVDGAGTTWTSRGGFFSGYSGTGLLTISNGGKFTAKQDAFIGYQAGAVGAVTVDGVGSTWNNGWNGANSLFVGYGGVGELNAIHGGQINVITQTFIGYQAGSAGTVTVDGVGSTLNINNTDVPYGLYVGYSGTGVLNITNGGVVIQGNGTYIAWGGTAAGTVSFGTNGGTLTTRSLYGTSEQVSGNGTINTQGMVGDGTMVFDATHGGSQTLTWSNAQGNVALHLDMTGSSGAVGDLGAGYQGAGSLTIRDGVTITCANGYFGYKTASVGTGTVDGTGSKWVIGGSLSIGNSGTGVLNITNGSIVAVTGTTFVNPASAINFGGNGGTLTTGSQAVLPAQVMGTGTINARGIFADGSLLFDATHGPVQTTTWVGPGRNVLFRLDVSGAAGGAGDVGVGYRTMGSLTVRDGVVVKSGNGYLGYNADAIGAAVIDGAGSAWSNSGPLYVGYRGSGSLSITNGGSVTNNYGELGVAVGATGAALVDGIGSSWTISVHGSLIVGESGTGTLTVSNGGKVNDGWGIIGSNAGSAGSVTVDGSGSTWINSYSLFVGYLGTGTLNIRNGGNVSDYVSGDNVTYIGDAAGSSGTVTVDGAGSSWTASGDIYLGYSGSGVLNITNGGVVTVSGTAYATNGGVPRSTLNFGSNGGTLTTGSLFVAPAQVTGNGTINTGGFFTDGNLSFDATHGVKQTLMWTGAQQNVKVYLDFSGASGSAGNLGVGVQSTGTLTIRDGVTVKSANGYLGYYAGTAGMAFVDGANSTWASSSNLYVGNSGVGSMTITRGGSVSGGAGYLGYSSGSTGWAAVDGVGSVWSGTSINVGYGGAGALSVTNGGKVNDTSGYVGYNTGVAGTAMVDGSGAIWANNNIFVGYSGKGTLTIAHGGSVTFTVAGNIGFNSGASGVVVVDGAGSVWSGSGSYCQLNVGLSGAGTLTVRNGGRVSSSYYGYLGYNTGSTGVASIEGSGSTWSNGNMLYVGSSGTGTLTISDGGSVTAKGVSINSASLVAMTVGDGSSLSLVTGMLTNSGVLRLKAAAGVEAGTYVPVAARRWLGSGTVTPVGGKWNSTTHEFTVAAAVSGAAGTVVGVDTSLAQRVAITDGTANRSVWLGFQGTDASSTLTVAGARLTEGEMVGLQGAVGAQSAVVQGWDFTTSGYTAGVPVALSVEVGAGYATDALAVWHWDGAAWTAFGAADLSYDGDYANFTVTGFSGYAVVAVPEPGVLSVVGLGLSGLLVRRRRGRGRNGK